MVESVSSTLGLVHLLFAVCCLLFPCFLAFARWPSAIAINLITVPGVLGDDGVHGVYL